MLKVNQLPRGTTIDYSFVEKNRPKDVSFDCIKKSIIASYYEQKLNTATSGLKGCNDDDYVINDAHPLHFCNIRDIISTKLNMLYIVKGFLVDEQNVEFDEMNGLAPTRENIYKAYEYSAVWIWCEIIKFIKQNNAQIEQSWYSKYKGVLSSVMRKYPKITGILISVADLKIPGNKLLDYSKMENADFDNDHTDEGFVDEKSEMFKAWILKWSGRALEKDKMRVKNWFETKKSHKQIFAEINKVSGNIHKFNSRLALFVERLFNQNGLEYFFEKTGFNSKEELFMAYFDKLTEFDEETKRAFIKKYLLG